MIIMYLILTRPCAGLILTSYSSRVETANSIDDKLSVAIDKYNIHKKKFIIKPHNGINNKEGLNFNFK